MSYPPNRPYGQQQQQGQNYYVGGTYQPSIPQYTPASAAATPIATQNPWNQPPPPPNAPPPPPPPYSQHVPPQQQQQQQGRPPPPPASYAATQVGGNFPSYAQPSTPLSQNYVPPQQQQQHAHATGQPAPAPPLPPRPTPNYQPGQTPIQQQSGFNFGQQTYGQHGQLNQYQQVQQQQPTQHTPNVPPPPPPPQQQGQQGWGTPNYHSPTGAVFPNAQPPKPQGLGISIDPLWNTSAALPDPKLSSAVNSPAVGAGQANNNKWNQVPPLSTNLPPPPPPPPPAPPSTWQQPSHNPEKPPLPEPEPPKPQKGDPQPLMNLPSPPLKIHQPKASSPNSPAVLTSSTIFGGPGLNSISSWEHFSNEPNYDLSPNPNKPPPPPGPPPAPAAAPPPPPPPAAAQPKPKQDESPHKAHSKPVQAAGGMAAAYASTPPPPPKIPHSIQSPPAFLKNDHSIDGRIGSPLGARPPITPSGSMQEYPSRLAEQVERPASTKIPPAPQFVNYSPTRLKDSRQDDQHIAPHDNHSVTSPSAEPSYKKFGVPLPYAGSPKPRDSPKQKPKTLVSEAVQTDPYRSPSPPPKPKPKMRDMSTNTETEKNRWQALDDLDKFYISSVRRFIAMVRSEDAADSDQERMELFNEFFEHERIVRATRYGIAIKTPTPPPAITVEPLKIKKVHPNLGDGIANAAHLVVESAKSTPGGVSLGEEQSFNFADLQVPLNTPIGDDIKKRFSALADEVDDDVEIVTANVASGGRAHSMMISADDPAVKEHKRKVSQLQLRDAYKRPEHVRTISQQPQQVTVEKRPEHQRSKSHQHPPAPEKKAEHQRTESLAPNYQPFQPGISKVASPPMSPTVDGRKRSPSYVAFTPGAKKLEVPSRGSSPAASPSSADEKRERRNSLYKPYQAPPGHEKRRSMTTVPTTSPAGRRASMILNDLSGEPKQYEAFSPGRSPGRSPRSPARGNSPSGYAAYPGGRPTPQKRMSLSPSRAAAIQPLFGQSKTPQPVGSKPVIPFTPPKSKTPQPGAGLPYPTSDDAFKPKLGPAFQPPKSKTPYPEEENGLKMPQTGPMQLAILPLVQQDSEFEPVITPPEENRSISPMLAPPVNNSPLKSSRPARAMTVPPQEMDAVSVPSRPSTQKPVEKAVVPPPVELDIKPLVPQMPPVPPLNVFLPPSDRILPNKSAMEEVERNVLSIGTDFSALEELVKNFEKTALQKRIANDKARRARSDEHEEDCDRLFAEGKIEYFELTEMDAAFKKEENGKKEEEELQEYDLYIDTVYDPTVRELKRRLAVLEHQHHELLPILQAARMGRDAFDPKVPGILLTEGLPLLLHTVQLVETHHERLNQALIARDKKYRRMRTLILQIHSQTKEIRALNATLDLAERETTLRAITAHHSRIEVLNDELEAYVFSGIDRNIAFQDDLDVAVKNCLRFTDALSEQDKEDLKRVARIIRELEGINHHVMELLRNSLLRVVIAEAALEKAKVRVEALGEGKGPEWEAKEVERVDKERESRKEGVGREMEEKRRLVSEEARKVLDTVKVGLK